LADLDLDGIHTLQVFIGDTVLIGYILEDVFVGTDQGIIEYASLSRTHGSLDRGTAFSKRQLDLPGQGPERHVCDEDGGLDDQRVCSPLPDHGPGCHFGLLVQRKTGQLSPTDQDVVPADHILPGSHRRGDRFYRGRHPVDVRHVDLQIVLAALPLPQVAV